MAWRLGRTLGIPASGWAFGGDVRFPHTSPAGWVVRRAIERFDLIFYQSHELLEQADNHDLEGYCQTRREGGG